MKLNILRIAIMKYTDNKIGGYLTYDYVTKSVTILNIKEFDGLTDKQFLSNVTKIKGTVKDIGGTLTVFQHHYKIV